VTVLTGLLVLDWSSGENEWAGPGFTHGRSMNLCLQSNWPSITKITLQAMFVQEGDYIVIKKEANMKVLQVTLNK